MKKESVPIIDVLLLFIIIVYLSAIETLICRREISFKGCIIPSVLHKVRYMIFKIPIELTEAMSSTNGTECSRSFNFSSTVFGEKTRSIAIALASSWCKNCDILQYLCYYWRHLPETLRTYSLTKEQSILSRKTNQMHLF